MINDNLLNPSKQQSTIPAASYAAFPIRPQKQDSPYHDPKIKAQIAAQVAAQTAAAARPEVAAYSPSSIARSLSTTKPAVDRRADPTVNAPLGKDTKFPSTQSASHKTEHDKITRRNGPGNKRNLSRAAALKISELPVDGETCCDCGLKRHYFRLQDAAARLLPNERVAHCFRHVNPRTNPDQLVDLVYTPPDQPGRLGRGSFAGLQVCGSIWHCPVCAARITSERRKEIEKIVAAGYTLFMVSLTLRHRRGDDLHALRDLLNRAWGKFFKSGRWWQEFSAEYGVIGTIKAHELTYSDANGFHPHLHILFVCKRGQAIKHEDVSEDVKARWIAAVHRFGGDADWEHGADVTTSKNDGSDLLDKYFCKWGLEHEIASGHVKEGRAESYSMNDLLELAAQGEQWAANLWLQYATEYKGEQQLRWSNGLEAAVGIERKDHQELAEDTENQAEKQVIARLPYADFNIILQRKLRDELKERIGATMGNADLLWQWLNGQGIHQKELVHIDLREL